MKYILLTIIILLQGISKTADAVEKESKNNVFLDVYDFGATGKGKIPDTKAIQAAIDKSTENGGTVVFPKGVFLSGTIYLKDNVSLYLEPGAVILGSPEIEDYPKNMPDLEFYGSERLFYSLFYAEDKKNITIKGQGTIDGQGAKFVIKNNKKPYRYMNRPYIFWFIKSQNIHIEGINLRNSAFWMQHYLACDNLIIKGIKVYNHSNKNNDMIDIDGCKSVLISDCIGDSDDDALTIKSTSGRINENITVTNCIFSSHCNAIKCGTESSGGFKNITISNCIVKPSQSPTKIYGEFSGDGGIALELVDGGKMENIKISNIIIDGPLVPIFIRLGNRARAYKPDQGDIPVGTLQDITLSNITAKASGNIACSITGIPGHPVRNIFLQNIQISIPGGITESEIPKEVPENEAEYPEGNMFGTLPSHGLYLRHGQNISVESISFFTEKEDARPAFFADDIRNLIIKGAKIHNEGQPKSTFVFLNSQNIELSQSRTDNQAGSFVKISGKNSKDIYIYNNVMKGLEEIVNFSNGAKESIAIVKNNIK